MKTEMNAVIYALCGQVQRTAYQDVLDDLFTQRLIDTRNALRDLGWDDDGGDPMRHGLMRLDDHCLDASFEKVAHTANVVGMFFGLSSDACMPYFRDDLTLTPGQMARKVHVEYAHRLPFGLDIPHNSNDEDTRLDFLPEPEHARVILAFIEEMQRADMNIYTLEFSYAIEAMVRRFGEHVSGESMLPIPRNPFIKPEKDAPLLVMGR